MYQFYLDGELLPVAPEKLTVKIGNQNKTLTLINGEVEDHLLGPAACRSVSLRPVFERVSKPGPLPG